MIHFKYDKKQVLQALRYHFLSRPEIRILLILVNVFAIASAILLAFNKIQALSFLIFSLLWFILMLTIWRLLPASIYKRSQTFQDEFSMTIDEQGVELFNQLGSRQWGWDALSSFVESPHFFHLYFDTRSFFLVPKDAFEDAGQVLAVRQLAKEHVKKS